MSAASTLAILAKLKERGAPAAATHAELREWIGERFPETSDGARRSCVSELCRAGLLTKVTRDIVLNSSRMPPPPLTSAARLLMSNSVVSLHSVLGEAGFLNNPSSEATAVVPLSLRRKVGVIETLGGFRFRFRALPDDFFPKEGDLSCYDKRKSWPSFVPEKALVDWLALSMRPASRSDLTPPPLDSDESVLDADLLNELAERFDVSRELKSWRESVLRSNGGEEPDVEASRHVRGPKL